MVNAEMNIAGCRMASLPGPRGAGKSADCSICGGAGANSVGVGGVGGIDNHCIDGRDGGNFAT